MQLTDQSKKLSKWNEELKYRVFFSGEGFSHGDLDQQRFQEIKDVKFNKHNYPNVYKWMQLCQKQ